MRVLSTDIVRDFKNRPVFGKFSDPIVSLGLRRLFQNQGYGGRNYWIIWSNVLPSMGYQVLKIHAHEKFRKFLQGVTVIVAGWLPPRQARKLKILQDTWGFATGSLCFVKQVWGGGINRDMKEVLMSVGY